MTNSTEPQEILERFRTPPPPAETVIEIVDNVPAPWPAMIAIAVSKVQGQIDAVEAKENNDFANFKFAGVNIIYAQVIKKMAEANLIIVPLETRPLEKFDKQTKHGVKTYGKFTIGFQLVAHDGKGKAESWFHHTNCVTIVTEITGAVTAQAVMSFAQKTYLRGLFKMPVVGEGKEMELDGLAHDGVDEPKGEPPKKAGRKKAKIEPFNEKESTQARIAMCGELRALGAEIADGDFVTKYIERWQSGMERLLDADRARTAKCLKLAQKKTRTPTELSFLDESSGGLPL